MKEKIVGKPKIPKTKKENKSKIIAVDFDGVLSKAGWPNVGKPDKKVFKWLKERQRKGDKLILWTCRTGDMLNDALLFCLCNGLTFDAINENLQSTIDFMNGDTRKIFANLYLDDRNVTLRQVHYPKFIRALLPDFRK